MKNQTGNGSRSFLWVDPTQALRQIVEARGTVICTEPRILEALLRDCGPDRRAIGYLLLALREGIPQALFPEAQPIDREGYRRLQERLEISYAIDPATAAWAVDAWFYALSGQRHPWQTSPRDPILEAYQRYIMSRLRGGNKA
jgi:hypothetical protein